MPIEALPLAQQAEARRVLLSLQQATAGDLEELACLLAGRADAELLGPTEFAGRDCVHRVGAKALEAALAGRK